MAPIRALGHVGSFLRAGRLVAGPRWALALILAGLIVGALVLTQAGYGEAASSLPLCIESALDEVASSVNADVLPAQDVGTARPWPRPRFAGLVPSARESAVPAPALVLESPRAPPAW